MRGRTTAGIVALGVAVLGARPAARADAQPASLPLPHWQRTTWAGAAGPPRPGIHALRRTPDGYLWCSAIGALLRFDGTRFTVFDSTNTPAFRLARATAFENAISQEFVPMFVDRHGTLWIRGPGGAILTYARGRFARVARAVRGMPWVVADALDGPLVLEGGTLHRLAGDTLAPYALPPGMPSDGIWDVAPDTGGGLWIGTWTQGLWHVRGAHAHREASDATGGVRPLLQSADGVVWAVGNGALDGVVHRLVDGRWIPLRFDDGAPVFATAAAQGPDGSVWLPTTSRGLVRWRNGAIERFTKDDGLSNDNANSVVVDSGAVWVSTDVGVDRLRPATFATLGPQHGVPFAAGYRFAEDARGGMWMAGPLASTLRLLDGGIVRRARGAIATRTFEVGRGDPFALVATARGGGAWIAPASGGIVHVARDGRLRRWRPDGNPPATFYDGVEAPDGALWLVGAWSLVRFHDGRFRTIPIGPPRSLVRGLTVDGAGRVWASIFPRRHLLAFAGDTVVADVPFPWDDVAVTSLAAQGPDTLWAAGFRALVRVVRGRPVRLRVPALATALAPGAHLGVAEGYLWLASGAGIARVPLATLHDAADRGAPVTVAETFDVLDGLASPLADRASSQRVRVAADGRVWVATPDGVAIADPTNAVADRTPPRVHVEGLRVGGAAVPLDDRTRVAPNPDRVDLAFTAIGLLPERTRVAYRLDGADDRWTEAGAARVATYSRLRPGDYVFRVRAWNERGIPSARDATLRFRVLPAWYQSAWFLALAASLLAGATALGGVAWQRRRSRLAVARVRTGFEAQLAERTRIARELHDTLLQGFTGITLQLDDVRATLAGRADPSADELAAILGRADTTLREAREMVWDMRSPELASAERGDALGHALDAVARRAVAGGAVAVRQSVHGRPRRLTPAIETAAIRIAREAIANALAHAAPSAIELRLTYDVHAVTLEVHDDGRGATGRDLATAAARGHWGVAGMRERAQRAGGTFAIVTAPGEGTRVHVSLPAEPMA